MNRLARRTHCPHPEHVNVRPELRTKIVDREVVARTHQRTRGEVHQLPGIRAAARTGAELARGGQLVQECVVQRWVVHALLGIPAAFGIGVGHLASDVRDDLRVLFGDRGDRVTQVVQGATT